MGEAGRPGVPPKAIAGIRSLMHLPQFLSSALLAGFALAAQASPTLPGVGPAMQALVDRREIAGAVTLVTTKDKIVHLEANGWADIASRKPMQRDSPTSCWCSARETTQVTSIIRIPAHSCRPPSVRKYMSARKCLNSEDRSRHRGHRTRRRSQRQMHSSVNSTQVSVRSGSQ